MKGTISRLMKDKGFGFIKGDDNKEYFFHRSALRGTDFNALQERDAVEFEDTDAGKGPRAEEVQLA